VEGEADPPFLKGARGVLIFTFLSKEGKTIISLGENAKII